MNIASKTLTTTLYSATVSANEAKALALVAVKNKIGLAEDAKVVSSDVAANDDGSIEVTVGVEIEPAPVVAVAPSIVIPVGLGGIPTA